MTKKILCLLTVLSMLVSVFFLSSCGIISIGGDSEENWEYKSENMADSKELINTFFEETFKQTNMTVTAKTNGEDFFKSELEGSKYHIYYYGTKADIHLYVDGKDYVYALNADGVKTYMTEKEMYDTIYNTYESYVKFLDNISEEDAKDCTFNGHVVGHAVTKAEDGSTTSSATFEFVMSNQESKLTMSAEAENDLVKTMTISMESEGETRTTVFVFTYGGATVTIPDLKDYTKLEMSDISDESQPSED